MKVCVLSDIHSNLDAFQAVLKDMPKVDSIICAGDFVGYGAEPNEVVELARSKDMRAVLGNHDHGAITRDSSGFNPIAAQALLWTSEKLNKGNAKYLRGLPEQLSMTLGEKKVLVVHGSPRDPLFEYVFPDVSNQELFQLTKDVAADVLILGHTHAPMTRMIQGKIVLNPGSVGQPRDRDPKASYAILNIGKDVEVEQRRVQYDVEKAAKKIKSAGLPNELATRLFFGW
jgi:putative phosphoesterase